MPARTTWDGLSLFPISVGSMRHQIIVQRPVVTRGVDGSEVASWSTFVTLWGSISTTGGREFRAAKALRAELSHEIMTHYYAGIMTGMRIKLQNAGEAARYFNIESVIDADETRLALRIFATELVGVEVES